MSEGRTLSRRRFLQATAAASGAAAVGRTVPAAASDALTLPIAGASLPLLTSDDTVLHVVNRLTFGPTPELMDHVRTVGVAAFVDEQMNPGALDDSACDEILEVFPALKLTSQEQVAQYGTQSGGDNLVNQLRGARVVRAVWSKRQLQEMLVDLWGNHFNTFPSSGNTRYLKIHEDRAVLRPHVLGRFRDLLVAQLHNPAMLAYLDNMMSSTPKPNENLAREMLELHTVGSDGGYSEADVAAAAKVLTGMSVDFTTCLFRYKPELHHVGAVKVMGWSHANATAAGGEQVANSLAAYLATHPATAKRVAWKLCVRFVSDTPSTTLVSSAAQVYLDNDTSIAAVLRHILGSQEFAASKGAKLRRPMELVAAHVRNLRTTYEVERGLTGANELLRYLGALGQLPSNWWLPDGYPDTTEAWLSSYAVLTRWEFAQQLSVRDMPGVAVPPPSELMPFPRPQTAGAMVDEMVERLAYQPISTAHRDALLRYVGLAEGDPVPDAHYSWQLPQLAALVLSSPYLQHR